MEEYGILNYVVGQNHCNWDILKKLQEEEDNQEDNYTNMVFLEKFKTGHKSQNRTKNNP